ncbi:MAG TPA: N-acetylglutaminylglutamine amidotransferase, partial [Paracoccaceae bacterium]|nr:N-acetylglutaminylglutamine amidotransferase [Paracoccaceae bacterium]
MSGICGEARFDGGPASAAGIEKMAEMLAPRGPDGFGLVLHGGIGLSQRRLATIGLGAAAAQPFTDTGLGLTIAMDGAILNHHELRRELEGLGHEFASAGDAEVVLKAWAEWGPSAARRFAGMFAFALHERDSGRLVLVRDRFGMKPLYLTETGKALSFASTLPALLSVDGIDRSIDPVALHHYMSWHAVVPAPRTILHGVRKLPPATIRIYDADGSH